MSRRISTRTPILDMQCLIEALNTLQYYYTQQGENIIVKARYYDIQYIKSGTHYKVTYNDHDKTLVDSIEKAYIKAYYAKLERLEKERLEQEAQKERQRLEDFKQAQKEQIIAKAKARGYKVKEVKKGNTIQLVCVRYV